MNSRTGTLLVVALGSGSLCFTAYLMIMTTFMIYDDEGFVLMSLRQFLSGQPLYDTVFSQYGPTPYLYHWLLTGAGTWELTHVFGRWVTTVHWVTCAVMTGWIASRLVERHQLAVGGCASLISFNLLWQMVAEPSHPGSMIAATLALGTAIGVRALEQKRIRRLAALIGALAAALVLTKINVGLFFVASAGAFALLHSAWPKRWQTPARMGAGIGLAVLPWLLMAGNLSDPRMLAFAFKASLAGAGLWWLLSPFSRKASLPPGVWWWAVGTFVGLVGLIVGFTVGQGTSWPELVAAVVIDPLRQPGNFTVPPRSTSDSLGFTLIVAGLVAWAGWQIRNRNGLSQACRAALMIVRIATLVAFASFALRWPGPWGVFTLLDYALPVIALWVVPQSGNVSTRRPTMTWVALIACLQVLHAYPVAGSQIGWGCFLVIAVFVAGAANEIQSWSRRITQTGVRVAMAALLVAAGLGTASLARAGWERYQPSQPLPFKGAHDIRLDDRTRIALSVLVQNAMVHTDVLFSRQGMYSFNIWSDTPTPTTRNATHWFWLLDEDEQRGIIDQMAAHPQSGFIVSEPLDQLLTQLEVPVGGSLHDFLETSYRSLFTIAGFSFRVPTDSTAQELGFASFWVSSDPEGKPSEATSDITSIVKVHTVLRGDPVAWQIYDFNPEGSLVPTDLALIDPRIAAARANGDVMGASQPLSNTTNLQGLFVLTASTAPNVPWQEYAGKAWAIVDADGAVLAEGVFAD